MYQGCLEAENFGFFVCHTSALPLLLVALLMHNFSAKEIYLCSWQYPFPLCFFFLLFVFIYFVPWFAGLFYKVK